MFGVLGHGLVTDEAETFRHLRVDAMGWLEDALFLVGNQLDNRISGERHFPGQEVIHRHAQGINVAAVVNVLGIAGLLGGHVMGRPKARPALRHRHVFVSRFGQSQVGDLDHSLFRDQDIVGLDVPMDHVQVVRVLQSLCHDACHQHRIGDGEPTEFVHPVLHALAIHQLHGDKVQPLFLKHAVALHDVRVVDLGHRSRFANEAFEEARLLDQFLHHDLERTGAVEADLLGQINGPHPSLPQLLQDLEVAEDLLTAALVVRALRLGGWFGIGGAGLAHGTRPVHVS